MSSPSSNAGPTFAILALICVASGIVSLVIAFSVPSFKCDQVRVKFFDFARKDKQRAIDLCTSSGGELKPDSGLWLGALTGLGFFGGGGGAVYVARRNNSRARLQSNIPAAGPVPPPPQAASRINREPAATSTTVEGASAVLDAEPPFVATEAFCHKCGAATLPEAQFCASCGAQTIAAQEGASQPAATGYATSHFAAPRTMAERLQDARPASFGNRVPAFVVDSLLMAVIAIIIMLLIQATAGQGHKQSSALGGVYILIMAATFVGYEWVSGLVGVTLGMRLFFAAHHSRRRDINR